MFDLLATRRQDVVTNYLMNMKERQSVEIVWMDGEVHYRPPVFAEEFNYEVDLSTVKYEYPKKSDRSAVAKGVFSDKPEPKGSWVQPLAACSSLQQPQHSDEWALDQCESANRHWKFRSREER